MEREEGLPHLHTDRLLLFLCVLHLHLNQPSFPSAISLDTFILSFSPFVSILCFCLPPSPHLYSAHRAITTSHYHTISVSLHLFHYLLYMSRTSSLHALLYIVCVGGGTTYPEAQFCGEMDIRFQFTGFLRLQCIEVFTSTSAYQCELRRYYAGIDYMFACVCVCVCAEQKQVSLYAFFCLIS